MPKPHPKEFRDDVVAVARRGEAPIAQIAKDSGSVSRACGIGYSALMSQTATRPV